MSVMIRQARPEDAEQLIEHLRAIAAEPDSQILLAPGECQFTLEEERQWVNNHVAAKNSTILVAEADGKIVGVIGCDGGERNAVRHVVNLGISLRKEWRNQGVGRALMERAISWAKASGIVKRIELQVTVRNPAAIRLYEKLGFEKEGRLRRGFFKNGEYIDLWIMALLLE